MGKDLAAVLNLLEGLEHSELQIVALRSEALARAKCPIEDDPEGMEDFAPIDVPLSHSFDERTQELFLKYPFYLRTESFARYRILRITKKAQESLLRIILQTLARDGQEVTIPLQEPKPH